MNRRELFSGSLGECASPQQAGAQLIPNVALRNQDNVPVRFYDDLVKGKQVVINMMYAHCEGFCSMITSRMVEVHRALAPRMGKDLFMYSITLKPEQDDPAALKEFARAQRADLPGWQFLTGDAYDIDTLRFALFRHDHIKIDLDLETHAARLRIINDGIGRWLHVAAMASPMTVLQHISWADPPQSEAQRRAENRRLQQQIDQEVARYGYRKVI
jgi:protein SCO1/2